LTVPGTASIDAAQIAQSLQAVQPGLAAALRRGDVLDAVVRGVLPPAAGQAGNVLVDIDGVALTLNLPQPPPVGSVVRLRVEATGQTLRLSVLPAAAPVTSEAGAPVPPVLRSLSPQAQAAMGPVPAGSSAAQGAQVPVAAPSAPLVLSGGYGPVPGVPNAVAAAVQAAGPPAPASAPAGGGAAVQPVQVTVALATNAVPQARPEAVEVRLLPTLTPGRYLAAMPGFSQTIQLPPTLAVPVASPIPAIFDASRAQLTLSLPAGIQAAAPLGSATPPQGPIAAPAAPQATTPPPPAGQAAMASGTSGAPPPIAGASGADPMARLHGLVQQALPVLAQLPDPVRRAVTQLAGRAIGLEGGTLAGAQLRTAVQNAGVFLESRLLAGRGGGEGDVKSVLAALGRAMGGSGEVEAIEGIGALVRRPVGVERPMHRGPLPPPAEDEMLPALVRNLAQAGEEVLGRIRLHQASSVPDEAVRQAGGTEWRLEVPFMLFGTPLTVPLRITREGRRGSDGQQAQRWTASFSVSLGAEVGAIGAHVGLAGSRISCVLWAEDDAIAEELRAGLDGIATSLAAVGLSVGGLAVRRTEPAESEP
jgi:hypothetical protein